MLGNTYDDIKMGTFSYISHMYIFDFNVPTYVSTMCNHCAISCRLPIDYDGSFHHRRRCNTTKQPYPYKVSKVRFDKSHL